MYLADYHTHSATSPDGQLTVSELAEAAVRAGLDEICVTDIHRAAGHPAGGGAGRGAHGL